MEKLDADVADEFRLLYWSVWFARAFAAMEEALFGA